MDELRNFNQWLWTDWGKPNFLTRLGIPRIFIRIVAWVLWWYVCWALTIRFVPGADKQAIEHSRYNPFFLSALVFLFFGGVCDGFIAQKYGLNGKGLDKWKRGHRANPVVTLSWVSLALMFIMALIGCLQIYLRSH
jgi:hypothetical protein